jgi:hypothetical protein
MTDGKGDSQQIKPQNANLYLRVAQALPIPFR